MTLIYVASTVVDELVRSPLRLSTMESLPSAPYQESNVLCGGEPTVQYNKMAVTYSDKHFNRSSFTIIDLKDNSPQARSRVE